MESSFSSAWHGESSPPEAVVKGAVCRVADGSRDTAYSPWWVEEEGCRLCLAKRTDDAEKREQKKTEKMASTPAVDGAAVGSSPGDALESKSECKTKGKGGKALKNGIARLLTRSRTRKAENACSNIGYLGVDADVGGAQLSAGLPSHVVTYAARGLKPLHKATSPPSSRYGLNDFSLLTKNYSNMNIDSKTERSETESNSDKRLHILAPEYQDDTERKSTIRRETFPPAEPKMPVVKTGFRGPWSTVRRQRAGSFDPTVSDSSRISSSPTDSESSTLFAHQPPPPEAEQSSQTPSTQSWVPPTTGPDVAEDVSGRRPLTPLEVLKKPFPTELFDAILDGRGRARRSSSTSTLSSHSSPRRGDRGWLQSPSSRGQSNPEPESRSGSEPEVGDGQDDRPQPRTINPSRFPRLSPAVTRCTPAHDGEDSPTTFLSHVDELDVLRQRRSAMAKTSTTPSPSHGPLRRTKKSSDLNKDAESVGGKTVRFFLGHLPTGTVPRIAISSVPGERTHILPPTSEINRSSLSVNKKLHGATLVKRNAERRAERSRIVQKRAVRIYKMELGSNGGDKALAKTKAEKWLNCEATRRFVAGWIGEGLDPITNKPGTWRDVDEIWGYGGNCHPARCSTTHPCGGEWCKNQRFVPSKLPECILDVQPKKQPQQPESKTTAPTTKGNRPLIGFRSKHQHHQPQASATTTAPSNSSETAQPTKSTKRDFLRQAALKAKNGIYKSCRRYTAWRTMDLFAGEGKACV